MIRKGFAIIELIVAVSLIAIVVAVVMPKAVDLYKYALEKSEDYTAGSIRTGIQHAFYGTVGETHVTGKYPEQLDNATTGDASLLNPLFTEVLSSGITSRWYKTDAGRYKGPTGREYLYDPATGIFSLLVGSGDGTRVGRVYDTPQTFTMAPTQDAIYNCADTIGCERDTLYGIYSFLTTYPPEQTAVTYFSISDGAGGWIQWNARIINDQFIVKGGNIVVH
jgi:prepilin-type N-terminal cleavage/methylation domain-containing protein